MKSNERLDVVVHRARESQVWLYRKPDSLWTILRVVQEGSGRKFVAKGVLPFEPKHGDRLRIEGFWKRSDFSGLEEFSFVAAELMLPTDARGLLEYAAEITKGVGPVIRQAIWDAYGEAWAGHPDLDGITGVTETTRDNWRETLRRIDLEKAKSRAMGFLLAKCCTMGMAMKAWEEWGEETEGRVAADCYCLCELPRVGFLTVENQGIRQAFGIADADPRRLRAAVQYAMGELTGEAGTLVPITTLLEHATMVGVGEAGRKAIEDLTGSGALIRLGEAVALRADYEAERLIAEYAA